MQTDAASCSESLRPAAVTRRVRSGRLVPNRRADSVEQWSDGVPGHTREVVGVVD
jgi:hypothetical protein